MEARGEAQSFALIIPEAAPAGTGFAQTFFIEYRPCNLQIAEIFTGGRPAREG
jgi:hypothetical protein